MVEVVVPARFNGPPRSANGGYAAGAIVEALRVAAGWSGDVTVRLLNPPPLDVTLDVTVVGGTAEVRPVPAAAEPGLDRLPTSQQRPAAVAVARRSGPSVWTDHAPVPLDAARAVDGSYPGLRSHPFPTCFSCGPGRQPGDGLRIFPGRLADDRVAAPWTPDASVADPSGRVGLSVTWAALDCVGGWSSDLEHRPLVLAEMCARVVEPPRAGTAYAVVGTRLHSAGRKTWTASALFEDERLVARAEQLWIAVDWAVVQHLQQG